MHLMPQISEVEFAMRPLAFVEDAEQEKHRIMRLRREDPIAVQDAVNTSRALVDGVRELDLEELQSVVANAQPGEFLQFFILHAFLLAVKSVSLPIVKALVNWGTPIEHEELALALHAVCEATTRENFSDAWRIVQLLVDGNGRQRMDVNTPRPTDGWTPLCIACADACVPLAAKLLEMRADPNVITRKNETPLALAKVTRPSDTAEQQEGRSILANMLVHHGAQESWRDALKVARLPPVRTAKQTSAATGQDAEPIGAGAMEIVEQDPDRTVVAEVVSATHTRFSA